MQHFCNNSNFAVIAVIWTIAFCIKCKFLQHLQTPRKLQKKRAFKDRCPVVGDPNTYQPTSLTSYCPRNKKDMPTLLSSCIHIANFWIFPLLSSWKVPASGLPFTDLNMPIIIFNFWKKGKHLLRVKQT